ncbi:Na+/H+ antiporter NhaA [Lichenihabitans sp. Uapishka_5]|uniref:Na+/H+ antiporter NhaA n=1 Tax=Lichenihabitans sp. Uapishka_5 TaxID=3037302 RepID=UPI0029E7D2E3|nr:Na+/H+ antiporter NhaA [Lichenihabitans sp. Uapishka_5]MDX7951512.1 Na+/H+ antiporter NhaA [Lichenihabitans sp. Uapishka_5]
MTPRPLRHLPSALRRFIDSEAGGGLVLMGAAALALILANSPLGNTYRAAVHATVAGHTVETWVNDALMAVFFLLVGLEIKRETLHGQLRTWPARILPGFGALGGMAAPAAIFAAVTWHHPGALRGWAIPSATDIAFALGVLALLGDRVPASLKVFLTALAVLDDLGAVLIIALFYADGVSLPMLGAAAVALALLVVLNRCGIRRLWPYLGLGLVLWACTWGSGIHPTIAGVLLAFTIPDKGAGKGDRHTPLHRLETALSPVVAFAILPLFALVNAGVEIGGAGGALQPVTLGVALGLALGKQLGVMASLVAAVKLGLARRPAGASWPQVYGVSLLCGIGFTMSLFIGLLAYAGRPDLQADTKLGVLAGSLVSALLGALLLRLAPDGRRKARAVPTAR